MTYRPRPTPVSIRPTGQRGVTLLGLVFWAVVISVAALVAMRILPTVNEYATIKRVVTKVAAEGGTTVPEIRAAFERSKNIEYSIQSISGKDLDVTKDNDRVVVSFAYDKEIELFGPVSLLIKYRGRSQ
jgi:Tfp pilus assembly major pilin PilA